MWLSIAARAFSIDSSTRRRRGHNEIGEIMDRLDILWEIEQIKQLKARYFRVFDTKQWHLYRAVFTDDAKIWVRGDAESDTPSFDTPEAFVEAMQTGHDTDHVVSVHQGHMPEIEILSETTARGIWAMFDWVERPQMRSMQGFGHYYEEYKKGDDGKWRIQIMKLTRLRVDNSESILESAPAYGFVPKTWPASYMTY
jgi:hypothetical protein